MSGTVGPRDQKKPAPAAHTSTRNRQIIQMMSLIQYLTSKSATSADKSTFCTDSFKDLILENSTGKKLKEIYAKLTVME